LKANCSRVKLLRSKKSNRQGPSLNPSKNANLTYSQSKQNATP